MLPIVIAAIAALAVVFIAIGISMSGGSSGVASRLERYASAQGMDIPADGPRESALVTGLSRAIEGQDLATRLSIELARADLKLRPAEFLIFWAISPVLFVAMAFALGIIFSALQNPVALAVAF